MVCSNGLHVILAPLAKQSSMKILTCDLCTFEASGETFDEWMDALKPHYATAHADVISNSSKTKEDMVKWMEENKKRFTDAPDVAR